jgi:hypothetical protein
MENKAFEKACLSEIAAALSEEQLAMLDHIMARLEAAEKVCTLVGSSLKSRGRSKDKGKRIYWWDVAIAIEEWEKLHH